MVIGYNNTREGSGSRVRVCWLEDGVGARAAAIQWRRSVVASEGWRASFCWRRSNMNPVQRAVEKNKGQGFEWAACREKGMINGRQEAVGPTGSSRHVVGE